jgi:anti-sigma regulatory factor (Ser/Thr protein kinase)
MLASEPGVVDAPHRVVLRLDHHSRASRRARAAIARFCDGRYSSSLVDDAQLVASELVTNALEHGADGVVTLDVVAGDRGVTIAVTCANDGWRPARPEAWALPSASQRGGRGLAFTSMLSSDITVERLDGVFDRPGCLIVVASVEGAPTDDVPGGGQGTASVGR